jgi:hypothetical protein
MMLTINDKTSKPFSAITLPPFYNFKSQGNKEKIITTSRSKYAGNRREIDYRSHGLKPIVMYFEFPSRFIIKGDSHPI